MMNLQEPATAQSTWGPIFCLAAAAVGVLLVIAGVGWGALTDEKSFWTEEQAREFAAASDALHAHRSGEHSHAHAEHDEASEGARERFERIAADLDRARYQRDEIGPMLIKVGLAATIAFGIGYGFSQRAE
jgi:outer membrane murein-binding lipoprotein Lpp